MGYDQLSVGSGHVASAVPTPAAERRVAERINKGFWLAIIVMTVVVAATAHVQNVESGIGAACICAAALLPTWLWIIGRVKGLPLFPLFAATHIYAFALPLLYEHPIVAMFNPNVQLTGALTVTSFLLLGTTVWYQIGKGVAKPIRRCLVLNSSNAEVFFLAALGGGAAYNMASLGAWVSLPPEFNSIVRASALALEALAAFSLSFRYGSGALPRAKSALFGVCMGALLLSTLPGLLLINAMSIGVITGFGFTLGARRLPWRLGLVAALLIAFLHAGKGSMRELYWKEDQDPTIQPTDYPAFLGQWIRISAVNWFGDETESEEHQSLIERASLMQLLLTVQTMTPSEVPYLRGETYAIIPALLIPRIFSEDKVASHEGTYLLNIHYGFQTREDTARTTIGFGLLNEAYANLGFFGIGGLAILLGAFYAWVARWARGAPVLSFRCLFAAIVASYSFQSEFASGVYVAALFQSTVALCGLAMLFMRTEDVTGMEKTILD